MSRQPPQQQKQLQQRLQHQRRLKQSRRRKQQQNNNCNNDDKNNCNDNDYNNDNSVTSTSPNYDDDDDDDASNADKPIGVMDNPEVNEVIIVHFAVVVLVLTPDESSFTTDDVSLDVRSCCAVSRSLCVVLLSVLHSWNRLISVSVVVWKFHLRNIIITTTCWVTEVR